MLEHENVNHLADDPHTNHEGHHSHMCHHHHGEHTPQVLVTRSTLLKFVVSQHAILLMGQQYSSIYRQPLYRPPIHSFA